MSAWPDVLVSLLAKFPDSTPAQVAARLAGRIGALDGLQRLTTARMFLRDEVPIFGRRFSEIEGRMRLHMSFKFVVNELARHADVLRWYLELNGGGTPHPPSELDRVRGLLAAEVGVSKPT